MRPFNNKHLKVKRLDHVPNRPWSYCIQQLRRGYRLVRGADLHVILEAVKLEQIEKYIDKLKKIDPSIIIKRETCTTGKENE